MKLFFNYHGKDFRDYDIGDVAFDYIKFESGGKEYIIDTTGEIDINFDKDSISGRFKGEITNLVPEEPMPQEEIESAIQNMNKETFEIGLFEEGDEPSFTKLDVEILVGVNEMKFSLANKDGVKKAIDTNLKPLDYSNPEDVEAFKGLMNKLLREANLSTEEAAFFLENGANIYDKPDQLSISDGKLYFHKLDDNSSNPQKDYPSEFNACFENEKDIRDLFERTAELAESNYGEEKIPDFEKNIIDKFHDIATGWKRLEEKLKGIKKEPEIEQVKEQGPEEAELTEEDLAICKKVIPPAQYAFTLELTHGEEGEYFENKLKEIANTYRRINTDSELVNDDGSHNVGFRYFLGSSEFYVSEIDNDGICFGYNILNGDLQMSEWGSTLLDEITGIPFVEMDYHVPEGATIEGMLHSEHPDYFPDPKKKNNPQQVWDDYIENVRAFLPEKDFGNKAKVLSASKKALASLTNVEEGARIVNEEFSKRGVKDEKSLVLAIREATYPELAKELNQRQKKEQKKDKSNEGRGM